MRRAGWVARRSGPLAGPPTARCGSQPAPQTLRFCGPSTTVLRYCSRTGWSIIFSITNTCPYQKLHSVSTAQYAFPDLSSTFTLAPNHLPEMLIRRIMPGTGTYACQVIITACSQ